MLTKSKYEKCYNNMRSAVARRLLAYYYENRKMPKSIRQASIALGLTHSQVTSAKSRLAIKYFVEFDLSRVDGEIKHTLSDIGKKLGTSSNDRALPVLDKHSKLINSVFCEV